MQNNFFGSKLNSVLLLILIILLGFVLRFMYQEKATYLPFMTGDNKEEVKYSESANTVNEVKSEVKKEEVKSTYTYTNHGFSIELPKGFVVKEMSVGTGASIPLPNSGTLSYITDAIAWEKDAVKNFKEYGNEKMGPTNFRVFKYNEHIIYWFKQGNVGYAFWDVKDDDGLLETFKFVGWPQNEGNTEDLISFSIKPGQEVSGKMEVIGIIKGGYFFEGSFPVDLLDSNKKSISSTHATAVSEWMTSEPVSFKMEVDFSGLPKGSGYIKLSHEVGDNQKVRSILIPIMIK